MIKYNLNIIFSVLYTFSIASIAADSEVKQDVKQSPTSTLSSAASAANSAVNAANAAAVAASAAASAALATVEAINAVLPFSQRVVPNAIGTQSAAQITAPSHVLVPSADVITVKRKEDLNGLLPESDLLNAQDETQNSVTMNGKFSVPSERSLVGLVGTFEIPVSADARGDFAVGVQSEGSEAVESVSSINLAQAVKASLGFSRDVHVASSRVEQAKAQTGQARAFLLPSLLVSMRTGREQSSPGSQLDPATGRNQTQSNHSRSDRSITLKQPLFDLTSLYDWRRREVVEKSREESVRASQGDAYLATVNAYLALVSSRVQASMALDYENQLQELFQYIDKRASAGAATNSDKERVRARSLNARASRIEQDGAQAAAGVEFVRLVNIAPAALRLPDMEDIGISIVPAELQNAISQAIESNPDVAVLKEELKAAQIDQAAVKGRFLPRLDLELSDNNIRNLGGETGIQQDKRMMLVMNWSMFNGGSDLKLRSEKIARTDEINYRLDDQRRRVLQSLTAQYATLEATRQRITAGYRELDSISTAAKAMSNRMVSGNQSLLDMLDVYDRYYQARTRLVALHVQEMGAVAQIARLVQGVPIYQGLANLQPAQDDSLKN